MGREIICVQVGQCGNQLGSKWWDLILKEHQTNPQYVDAKGSLFYESTERRGGSTKPTLKARCVPIDMEEGVLNAMLRGPLGSLFDASHFVSDVSGAGNNWAVGHMEYGDRYIDDIEQSVSTAVEQCDSLQSFLIMHSLSGGTGSGLGTRVLSTLEDAFPKVFRFASVVSPGPDVDGDVVVAPYNSCFALRELTEHADCVVPLDNSALAKVVDSSTGKGRAGNTEGGAAPSLPPKKDDYSVAKPTKTKLPYDQMNAVAAQMLSNLTCSMRFPGQLNMDLNEITTNLVPYNRLHYLTSAIAPLSVNARTNLQGGKSLDAMFTQCLDSGHQLCSVPTRGSTFLASAFVARGTDVNISDVTRNVGRMHEKMNMIYWNTDGFKTALCSVPPAGHPRSLLMLANNCSISSSLFRGMRDNMTMLYSVKSHVHHYTQYLEESYFDQTLEILNEMMDDYSYLSTVQPEQPPPKSLKDLLVFD